MSDGPILDSSDTFGYSETIPGSEDCGWSKGTGHGSGNGACWPDGRGGCPEPLLPPREVGFKEGFGDGAGDGEGNDLGTGYGGGSGNGDYNQARPSFLKISRR